jgi:hypothetical protein
MAIHTGHDVTAGLAVGIGTPEIVVVTPIAGFPVSMLFRSPIKCVKVSVQLITVDRVLAVVTVRAKGHIIRHVGPVIGVIPLRFISACVIVIVGCLIGVRTGITVHPLTGVCTIYIPITVMGAGK